MTTKELVQLNRDIFIKTSSMTAKTAIFTAFPYLNIPPLNFLINQALDWIILKIADGLELSAYFIYTDIRVEKEGRDYIDALKNANTLQTEESQRLADEAFKRLISFRH